MRDTLFEWDDHKNHANIDKHGISFYEAQEAFFDPCRVIAEDSLHSHSEQRFFCFGRVANGVLTVRFTYRLNCIRIYGAGYWREGKKLYEKANKN